MIAGLGNDVSVKASFPHTTSDLPVRVGVRSRDCRWPTIVGTGFFSSLLKGLKSHVCLQSWTHFGRRSSIFDFT